MTEATRAGNALGAGLARADVATVSTCMEWIDRWLCVLDAYEQDDELVEIATAGCALPSAASAAPHLYRRVSGGDFSAAVQVLESSSVAWSGGGLLVTSDHSNPSDWAALRVVQARAAAHVARRTPRRAPPLSARLHRPGHQQ